MYIRTKEDKTARDLCQTCITLPSARAIFVISLNNLPHEYLIHWGSHGRITKIEILALHLLTVSFHIDLYIAIREGIMQTNKNSNSKTASLFDSAIKLAVIAVMAVITFRIIQPFIIPVTWGVIIAVTINPFINIVIKKTGLSRKMASTLFALLVIAALVVPSILLVSISIDTVQEVSSRVESGTLVVPSPPSKVAEWPVIGEPLYKAWNLASANLDAALNHFGPQLKEAAILILGKAGGGVKDVLMFVISIVIAAVLLITAEKGSNAATKVISRFAGEKGPSLQALATATIRGVMLGVIGVAVIQSVLSAIGMVIVGVPAAGLWAALVLILAVIQLPPIIILGPIAAWVFTFTSTGPAVIFLVWVIIVSACDGFLKPVLMGRGVDAPMLVILLGALGGMMLSGIIGLFVGAIIVAISYTLFMAWLEDQEEKESTDDEIKQ